MSLRKNKSLVTVCFGHFVIDSFSGFFPMYIAMRDINILKAGAITTTASIVANSLQPVFGFLSDRVDKRLVLCIALILGPIALSCIGLTDRIPVLAFLVISGQLMVSLYHPAGSDLATRSLQEGRSHLQFSIFTTVGSFGYALTGFIFYRYCTAFGFSHSYVLALSGIITAGIIYFTAPDSRTGEKPAAFSGFIRALKGHSGFLFSLYLITVVRASVQVALTYSLPTLFKEWGYAERLWFLPHFLFIAFGSLSMILCGIFEKRIPARKLIFTSMILGLPVFYGLLFFGMKGSWLAFVFVALTGFVNFSSFPANVVLGQKRLPEFAGTVSGILMGAGWAVAGLAPVLVSTVAAKGWFSDYGKLVPGMALVGLMPILGAVVSLRLKEE